MSVDLHECRRRLPLPALLNALGLADHAKPRARCPWPQNHKHGDRDPSFGIYQNNGSGWRWKCFVCGQGDEVDFIGKHFGLAARDAIVRYGELAGVNGNAAADVKPAAAKITPRPAVTLPKADAKLESDCGERWREAVAAFTDAHCTKLATWRGYSLEFVHWLREGERVGLFNGNVAFPVHDDEGQVVGIHYRVKPQNDNERAKWLYEGGCHARPLVVGDPKTAATVAAFESQWDAFAYMDKIGWHKAAPEAEAMVVTRGASNGKALAGLCATDAMVLAFPQNDKAGEDWLRDVSEHAGRKVLAVSIPAPHKDANDWTRAEATAGDIAKAVASAVVVAPTPPPLADTGLLEGMQGSLVTAAELHAMPVEPREFIVRPFFKAGDLGFIYGKRGDGKTWLTMLITRAAATAGCAGDWKAEKPWRVLYVDGEMPVEETKRRDKSLGTVAGTNLSFLHHEIYFERKGLTLNLADFGQQETVTRMLVAGSFRVLVLDNLSCLFSGLRENEADSWEMVLPWLLKLRRLKIAVVIVAHAGRNGQMRGTSRREDQAFWVIKLERGDGDGNRGLKFTSVFTKNRNALEDDCPPLEWTIAEEADGTTSVTAKQVSGVELLVQWVNAGLDSASDIAQEMGITKGQVSKLAKKAEVAGRIKIKDRRYLPAAGGVNDAR